jgi:two-component system chemotaxis response regulator CheB
MPMNALERVEADYVLPVAEMPALLTRLIGQSPKGPARPTEEGSEPVAGDARPRRGETEPSPLNPRAAGEKAYGTASGLSCPDCDGTLWELTEGSVPRLECRVGHAFSVDAFLGAQAVALEEAIWSAINALEERGSTLRRFAERFGGTPRMQADYEQRADLVTSQARLLREGLVRVIQAEEDGGSASSDLGVLDGNRESEAV